MPANFNIPASLRDMITHFQQVARFDHSVSVPELGSLFQFDETKALGRDAQRHPSLLALDPEAPLVEVGKETPPRSIVSVRHVVS